MTTRKRHTAAFKARLIYIEGIAKLASSLKSPFSVALQLHIRALLYQVCAQMWS